MTGGPDLRVVPVILSGRSVLARRINSGPARGQADPLHLREPEVQVAQCLPQPCSPHCTQGKLRPKDRPGLGRCPMPSAAHPACAGCPPGVGDRGFGGGQTGCPSPTPSSSLFNKQGTRSVSHAGFPRVPRPKLSPTDQFPLLCDLEQAPYPLWAWFHVRVGAAAGHFISRKSLVKKEVLGCCQPSGNYSVALSRGHDPSRRREDHGATKSSSLFN